MTQTDPLSPANSLSPGEILFWEGRPSAAMPATGVERKLRLVGVLMLFCFAFFALIGWANRAELTDAMGIFVGFLVLSGTAAILFLWGIPATGRAARARTRYGVTDGRALIVHGLGGRRITQIRVAADAKVRVMPIKKTDLSTVIFGTHQTQAQVRPVSTNRRRDDNRVNLSRPHQFEGLAAGDVAAAAAALERIKGKCEGPMFAQTRG